jgi:hypothetical protein
MEGRPAMDAGVAGARHFMRQDRYTWIAPLSAFYLNAVRPVDPQAWPQQFPRATLVADRNPDSRSRLRPDYIALRPLPGVRSVGAYEWAVAEAKGVADPLAAKRACPGPWYNQARSVTLTVDAEIAIPRHLVVATRVSPNARKAPTRRLQIRAWNRKEEMSADHRLPQEAAIDVASAHLFGLFRPLRLRENALAMALSVKRRAEIRRRQRPVARLPVHGDDTGVLLGEARPRAQAELARYTLDAAETGRRRVTVVPIETDRGTVQVEIAEPLRLLAEKLQGAPGEDEAALALHQADMELERLERQRSPELGRHEGRGPIGLDIRLPAAFERA